MLAALLALPLVQKLVTLGILFVSLVLFMRNRFRYDVVALLVMLAVTASGVLPYQAVLANFGHPVIIIVGSMFILSAALVHSGVIANITGRLTFFYSRPVLSLFLLCIIVASISAFVDNIGALAMVIPIALVLAQKSRTPIAFFLLPLAFASHMGGFLTLIGTPRNILISEFRLEATGVPFGMFDYTPVGLAVCSVGISVIFFYAYFFLPRRHQTNHENKIERTYITEAVVDVDSRVVNLPISKVEQKMKGQSEIVQIFRNNLPLGYTTDTILLPGDVLQLRGTESILSHYVERLKLSLTGLRALELHVTNADDYVSIEIVVPPYSKIVGNSWNDLAWRDRFGTNFIGIFRHSSKPLGRMADSKFISNDILLLQGRRESVEATINNFSLLPVAGSDLQLGRPSSILATCVIVIGAFFIATTNLLPLPVIFLTAVLILIVTDLISLRFAYESLELPVIVLLAGMITLGDAIEASGVDSSIAETILNLSTYVEPFVILGVVLVTTMLLSDFVNTTAAAVIMAPVGITIATTLGVSIDPFLMAVSIGASAAFLTPVGHESNALVLQKGGYSFSDFTKIGLPIELAIIAVSLPLITYVWPF